MADILQTPSLWVLGALVAYGIAYFVYSKWVDEKIWESSPDRPTPAHMYMDGVEFFPVSRSVLYGFQFKSVAALGPILGPFVALYYGWVPALLWIVLGNMFIGWVQDYSTIMITVRNEGRSMGPLVYQYVGERPRSILLGYLLFYLLIISAVFIYLISLFWAAFPGTFLATLTIIVFSVIIGHLLYKMQANIYAVTLLAIFAVILAVFIGVKVPGPEQRINEALGKNAQAFWMVVLAVILFIASIAPMPTFITPMNFVSTFPALAGVAILIIGALVSPAVGVTLKQPTYTEFWPKIGPLFPVLFVSIACGAISGWHSLVSTSTTGKQLDVETDARPVGAGAMLTEGMLALSALAAYMVLSPEEIGGKISSFVLGATRLSSSYLGGTAAMWKAFFALFLVIYAITVQTLVTRYWRVFSGEVFTGGLSFLGNKYIATITGLAIPVLFALSGSWWNLWIYFGGSNQLLAGLALMLVAIIIVRMKKPPTYALLPAIFMTIVTISALIWETYVYAHGVWVYLTTGDATVLQAKPPLSEHPKAAFAMNTVFVFVGIALVLLGLMMTYYLVEAFKRAKQEAS